jgi:MFS family permease
MGWHNSALTVGVALGAPLAGVVMDWQSPPWGFAAVGGVGVLVALLVLPGELRRRRDDHAAATAGARPGGEPADVPATGAAGPAVDFPSTAASGRP